MLSFFQYVLKKKISGMIDIIGFFIDDDHDAILNHVCVVWRQHAGGRLYYDVVHI